MPIPVGFAVAGALLLLLSHVGCSKPPVPSGDGLKQPEGSIPARNAPAPAARVAFGPTLAPQKIVKDGINVEFTVTRVAAEPLDRASIREGDDVLFQFKMTDKNGAPLARIYPAAWLDQKPAPSPSDPHDLLRRVQKFIGGGLFARAALDLNAYYVLALNDDPSITVVDPLFGFGGTKLLAP